LKSNLPIFGLKNINNLGIIKCLLSLIHCNSKIKIDKNETLKQNVYTGWGSEMGHFKIILESLIEITIPGSRLFVGKENTRTSTQNSQLILIKNNQQCFE